MEHGGEHEQRSEVAAGVGVGFDEDVAGVGVNGVLGLGEGMGSREGDGEVYEALKGGGGGGGGGWWWWW